MRTSLSLSLPCLSCCNLHARFSFAFLPTLFHLSLSSPLAPPLSPLSPLAERLFGAEASGTRATPPAAHPAHATHRTFFNPRRAVVAPYGRMELSWLLVQPYPFVVLTKGEGPTTTVNLERNFGRLVVAPPPSHLFL